MKAMIITFILIFNLFSIVFSWKLLNGFDKSKKMIIILISEIINFILMMLIYAMSSTGIEMQIHSASKYMMIFAFLPINIMITSFFILSLFNKVANEEIEVNDFKKKILIRAIIIVIVMIIEVKYLNNVQLEILKLK